ncbi:MAG: hypothetical protein IPK71_11625 [Myxococcales bacterium]|nr:hypothetical protein [Myxococcales bacterium]
MSHTAWLGRRSFTNLFLCVGSLVSAGIVACAAPLRARRNASARPSGVAPTASVVGSAPKAPCSEPCARAEARRRALAVPLPDSLRAEAFTRCRTTDAGALGLVATRAQGTP